MLRSAFSGSSFAKVIPVALGERSSKSGGGGGGTDATRLGLRDGESVEIGGENGTAVSEDGLKVFKFRQPREQDAELLAKYGKLVSVTRG